MALKAGEDKKKKSKEKDIKDDDVKTDDVEEPKADDTAAEEEPKEEAKEETKAAPAKADITLDDLKKDAEEYNYILANADKHIENPSAVIARHSEELENLGVLDEVQQRGLSEMFIHIKPVDVLAEAIANHKNKKSFRE